MVYKVYDALEVYPTEIRRLNPRSCVRLPVCTVEGRSFTRLIFRPTGRPDVLVNQVREDEIRYLHVFELPANAMQNQQNLFQGILANPPSEDNKVIPEGFLNIATWEHVSTVLSQSVDAEHLDGATRFRLEGHEAFGEVSVMREDEACENENWFDIPPAPIDLL